MVIVVDAAVDLPPELDSSPGVLTVPGEVWLGDQAFSGSRQEFWPRLRAGAMPSTRPPTVGALARAYRQAEAVVAVHVSAQLSATVSRAREALEEAANSVTLVDTGSLSVGAGLVAQALHGCVERRSPDAAVIAMARVLPDRLHTYVLVQDTAWLRRSGRAGLLPERVRGRDRPLILAVRGRAIVLEQAKNRSNGIRALAARAKGTAGPSRATWALGHGDAPDVADVVDIVGQVLGDPPSFTVPLDPAVGTHVGPGAVVVGVVCPP